jgi:hypothetical protein
VVPLLVLLLLLLLAPAAPAAAPGDPGAIAFVGERGGDRVLYVRSHGRTVGRLRGVLADPAWSPFGRRIAITRETPENGRAVWIYNLDGSGERQLTASELAGAHPSWSPSGRALTFAAGPIGQRTIHRIGADGLRERALTAGPEDQHSPVWSARDQIAFVAPVAGGGEEIFRIPSRGGTPRRLTFKPGADKDPAWSPKGDRIAWIRGTGGIWVMSRWGNGKHKVVNPAGGIEEGLSWSPDGKRLLFAAGRPGRRQIFSVKLNGKGLRPLSLPTSNGEDPDWQSVGHFPVIAAGGDIACDPAGRSFNAGLGRPGLCAMRRTSDLMLQDDLWAVIVLGDQQYPEGGLDDFYRSYGPSWGRLDPIARPVPGNHEYRTPGAAGYFGYYGDRAGPQARGGYYSFDVGDWHVIALNSNCGQVPGGGCETGSAQQRWLASDLRRNAKHCTLAYWHHPLFSSLAYEEGRGPRETRALWQTLHAAGADVVLNGHQHFYERLAPQDPNGNLDRAHGLRTFVVGTGGKSLDQADFRDPNSQAFSADAYGILELRLRPNGYDWRFRGAGPVEFFDSGRSPCH